MNNFVKHTLMSFIGVLIAGIVVIVLSAIFNEPVDNVAVWVALAIAGATSMTKQDRY